MMLSRLARLALAAPLLLLGCGGASRSATTAPGLTYTTEVAVYTQGVAITPDTPVGSAAGTYSVAPSLPAGLALDAASGIISGTPTAATAPASYVVTAAGKGQATLVITVEAAAPATLAYATPAAVFPVGVAITPDLPATTGGTASSFTVYPALPAGLALDPATGILAGTPTAPSAQATYTVTASNGGGSAQATLTLTVADAAPSALTYTYYTATFTQGTAITPDQPSTSGGAVTSYTVTPALPAGLGLDPATGVVSGTPTAVSAATSYTVTAANAGGNALGTLTFTVLPGAVTAPTAPADLTYANASPLYTRGVAITPDAPASSGGAVATYAVSPALPAGLVLNAATGILSGTPTALSPPTSYTVTAVNAAGQTTTTLTLTVADVAPASLAYGAASVVLPKGTAIAPLVPVTTGGAPTSYGVSPALPAGLALNFATGVISGTPAAASPASAYLVTAGNAQGSVQTTLRITVTEAAPSGLSYTTATSTYNKGVAITANSPTCTGTVDAYSVSPALPAGLSLNTATGVLTGTPTVLAATSLYAVTATNTGGSTQAYLTLTVIDAPPAGLNYAVSAPVCTVGVPIPSDTPSITSGGPPTSYAVAFGSLPAGLSLNTATGVISGTPTTVTSATPCTILALNSGGSAQEVLTFTVTAAPPTGLNYTSNPVVYTRGLAITADRPFNAGGALTSYSVSPALPTGLSMDPATGVITGKPAVLVTAASCTVTGTNTGGSTSAVLIITVVESPPSNLTYLTNPAVYTKGLLIPANTASSGGGPVESYSVSPALPAGLSLDPVFGTISGTPTALIAVATCTVTATNTGGSASAVLTLTVNDQPPAGMTYASAAPVYTVGTAIPANGPSIASGGAPTSYALTSGTLPAGLSLSPSTGVLSGTPQAVTAPVTCTVTATNTGGGTTASFTLTVNDKPPAGLAYQTNPASYVNGVAIVANPPTSTGGKVVAYTVSPALPAGLSLDPATGVLTGTPSLVQPTTSYLVTATNSGGSTQVVLDLTVHIAPPGGLTYTNQAPVYLIGVAIPANVPATASGGAPTAFALTSGTLPAGLSLDPVSGVITGTPAAVTATTSCVVTASNAGGSTPTTVRITVNDLPPTGLSYAANPLVCVQGSPVAADAPSIGGGAVVSWSVNPALPLGLSLAATTGLITGTPSVVAPAADYTVTATNSGGSALAVLNLTVRVAPPAGLAYRVNPATFTVGAAVTPDTPTSTGGAVAGYSVNPALPAGLALAPATGAITGTPTAIAPLAAYTVTATNASGSTPANLTITVVDAPPRNLAYAANPALCPLDAPMPPDTPTSAGGAVVAYSVSPALPAGLVLDPATGIVSGTATAAAAAANYTVTATNSGGSTQAALNLAVLPVPAITSFTAFPGRVFVGGRAGLTGTFNGGAGTVDTNVGAVTSGTSTWSGPLAAATTFNLTVSNGTGIDATAQAEVGVFTTAGTVAGQPADANLGSMQGVALDAAGNLYAVDATYHTIHQLTPKVTGGATTWVLTDIAGRPGVPGNQDGPGASATFTNPIGVAADSAGNLYVTDSANETIRKLTPSTVGGLTTWAVSTLAGVYQVAGSANGPGPSATFNYPAGVAVDPSGKVYVAEALNNDIRILAPPSTLGGSWTVTTLATGGALNSPYGLAFDTQGNLYVANAGNDDVLLLAPPVSPATLWTASTMAGVGGNAGYLDGPGTSALFANPAGVAVDAAGGVYVSDWTNENIRKITPTVVAGSVTGWTVSTLAGVSRTSGSSNVPTALFSFPVGLAVGALGDVYVADALNRSLRRLSGSTGAVTTLAGMAGAAGSQDGAGAAATFSTPGGLAVDGLGQVYAADTGNDTIRMLVPATSAGVTTWTVSTLAGTAGTAGSSNVPPASFNSPAGLAVDGSGNLYVADTGSNAIRMLAPAMAAGVTTWTVSTLAGTGAATFLDGPGTDATFKGPTGLALDGQGNLYVADTGNNAIRLLTPPASGGTTWTVSTLAGTGLAGNANGAAQAASFRAPQGVTVDGFGSIYVADSGNNLLRLLTPATSHGVTTWTVTTLAGAGSAGSADGPALKATFSNPLGLAVDSAGNVVVADNGNNTLRLVTPATSSNGTTWTVTTVAGSAAGGGWTPPGLLPSSLSNPVAVALDPVTGSLFLSVPDAILEVQ